MLEHNGGSWNGMLRSTRGYESRCYGIERDRRGLGALLVLERDAAHRRMEHCL